MYKKIMYLVMSGMISSLYAQSINEQIEAVKNAQPSERVEMMNALKVQIAAMNEHERMEAINILQKGKGVNQTSMQSRMNQTNINKGRSSIQQLTGHTNQNLGQQGQGRK